MNKFTLLETILIIYIMVINMLGVVAMIMAQYAGRKVGEITLGILLVVAVPISLPIVLYMLTVDRLKLRKRKKYLEKQFDDLIKEN